MNQPDIGNMDLCIKDVMEAALDNNRGPEDPTDFQQLYTRLVAAREKLPPLYQDRVYQPFIKALDELSEKGFAELLRRDPNREQAAGLLLDIAQAILQNGEGYEDRATDAFQEVVSDLYDGFLSASDRNGIKPPDLSVTAPLVKWGRPEYGPYTWTIAAASHFGLETGIVNLPPSHAKRGLLGWSALSHETAGHDILHADTGLLKELAQKIREQLLKQNFTLGLANYWSQRVDETASDVLGILNMGPAAGIGLIGYFRGLNGAWNGTPTLRNTGPEYDSHPADILRGYLAAETVRLLQFDQAEAWAEAISAETDKDLTTIQLGRQTVDAKTARKSAAVVAQAITESRLNSLEQHSLGQIQNWHNEDERIASQIRAHIHSESKLHECYVSGMYAAHVVAASVTASLEKNANIEAISAGMLALLKEMHDANPAWGPLYVKHRGDLTRHRAYRFPAAQSVAG
ncbi:MULTISPECIES: hypothetical protein [Brevibacillus]|jgi:hypothetical protein|uniref:hypothetical protein n=1 Tax=Brevibacillus TaxID=55080 RepID=UPI0015625F32|nr:hypothetical protein [Brevibacillus borstelensis]MBE5395616.1 hypothetical protein [Brevibacillus borstelensis]